VASYHERGETVDVFLPSCGEPLALLNNTLHHVSKMNWNGPMIVYVLDDSLANQYAASRTGTTSGTSSVPTRVR